ncbi:response regulator [Roseomonas terrae]|jgi:CheY-like chemotaxis protein|uniref:Response regulator n=1 Tax=Neoroseomonas terrae TaxID=424799 RepID=A0ABS5EAU2_9PROT|nr:response regulator [Neoroseomonas terrae]MBR0648137.1 response regulator [Neoroseomonas terrae]
MNATNQTELLRVLPYARRYARALTGARSSGDELVAAALSEPLPDIAPRLALYAAVARAAPASGPDGLQRNLLLLTALEDLTVDDAATILGIDRELAERELEAGRLALRASAATDILVIEDEPVIALDLKRLVETCGHRVVGIAASEAAAVRLAAQKRPGLILADINLGRGGDGSNAVARIQEAMTVPVIFVTAYPERLLTAEGVEPTFIISKPFEPLALAIATYQAVNGGRVPDVSIAS